MYRETSTPDDDLKNLIEQTPYGELLKEVLDAYLPLIAKLPSLRDDSEMLKFEVKSEGREGTQDVVTAADLYFQNEINKQLITEHNDWQFWGEEGNQPTEFDASKSFLLVVDPIEGTNNFRARKDDQWGSVLSLIDVHTGEPIIGIVAHPAKRKLYLGIKNAGAYVLEHDENGAITSLSSMSPKAEFGEFTYNNSPHFEQKFADQVDRFFSMGEVPEPESDDNLEKLRRKVKIQRGDEAVSFSDPESGALEAIRYRGTIYFKTGNEMAAVFVILEELGGKVTDGEGRPWHLGMDTLIAARNPEDYPFLLKVYNETLVGN